MIATRNWVIHSHEQGYPICPHSYVTEFTEAKNYNVTAFAWDFWPREAFLSVR